jgi:PIN domain nuclease of toxin-antitoxin system
MTVYVLDASAVLRYTDNEVGADRMRALLAEALLSRISLCTSAIQWGEIAGKLYKQLSSKNNLKVMDALLASGVEVIPASGENAVRAARLRVDRGIAYADAFALDLAMRSPEHVLVTADYGFKAVEDLAKIEFLPAK